MRYVKSIKSLSDIWRQIKGKDVQWTSAMTRPKWNVDPYSLHDRNRTNNVYQYNSKSDEELYNISYLEKISDYLRKHFWKEHTFWTDGYFVCSAGNVSEEMLRKYIENQG